jgi:hypothetical protein
MATTNTICLSGNLGKGGEEAFSKSINDAITTLPKGSKFIDVKLATATNQTFVVITALIIYQEAEEQSPIKRTASI